MNSIIPIEHSAKAMEHKGTVRYYIRHIFNALREHQELLTQYSYKRLYDEAIDYLFRYAVVRLGWPPNDRERCYDTITLLADLANKNGSSLEEKFSLETVNLFLEKRKLIWKITDLPLGSLSN